MVDLDTDEDEDEDVDVDVDEDVDVDVDAERDVVAEAEPLRVYELPYVERDVDRDVDVDEDEDVDVDAERDTVVAEREGVAVEVTCAVLLRALRSLAFVAPVRSVNERLPEIRA